jgi:hypothetical protein
MTLSELSLTTSALSLMEMDSNFPSPVRSVKSDPVTLKGNAMTATFPLDVTTEFRLRHYELELITDSARDVNDILVSLSVLDSGFFERIINCH